jgi:hypothetical protein
MSNTETQQVEHYDRLMGSYVSTIKVASICLLLGGGCLAAAKFLAWPSTSEARLLVPRLTEILGWVLLVSTATALFRLWASSTVRGVISDPGLLGKSRELRATDTASQRSRVIDALYIELRPLMNRAAADPSLTAEVQSKLSRLRQLQTEEADEMEKRFAAGLSLKQGEGERALERARELLARYENPSSPDQPTPHKS